MDHIDVPQGPLVEAEEQVPVQHQLVEPRRPAQGQTGDLPQAVVAQVQPPQCQACRATISQGGKHYFGVFDLKLTVLMKMS